MVLLFHDARILKVQSTEQSTYEQAHVDLDLLTLASYHIISVEY